MLVPELGARLVYCSLPLSELTVTLIACSGTDSVQLLPVSELVIGLLPVPELTV